MTDDADLAEYLAACREFDALPPGEPPSADLAARLTALKERLVEAEPIDPDEVDGPPAPVATFADAPDELALAGKDGARATALLAAAKAHGREVFARLAEPAVRRLLADVDPMTVPVLFTDDELKELGEALAKTTATADLLGRARVARLALRAERADQFAEADDDPFVDFAEPPPPLSPVEAVSYFRRLVPTLGVQPERYGPRLDRHSFTLAVAADEAILSKVKAILADRLQTGRGSTVADVQDVLDAAGVSSRNPQYADLVTRTNVNDSYMQGQTAELQRPEMVEQFPAWEYHAIVDGRERPTHGARNEKLYPATAAFAEVRGTAAADVCNCRCGFSPITRRQLAERQARGEVVQDTW